MLDKRITGILTPNKIETKFAEVSIHLGVLVLSKIPLMGVPHVLMYT